jgi:predicted Zn-dependent peptidase
VQTGVLFARPALRRADPGYAAAVVANQSLGGSAASRVFKVLREERGLTYGAYTGLTARALAGHFVASIDCRTEVTEEAVSGLLSLIGTFAREGPDPAELRASKSFLLGSFALAHETPAALVQNEVSRLVFGLPRDDTATWRERVTAESLEDAQQAASRHFEPSDGILAVVGDADAIGPALEHLGPVTVWHRNGKRLS